MCLLFQIKDARRKIVLWELYIFVFMLSPPGNVGNVYSSIHRDRSCCHVLWMAWAIFVKLAGIFTSPYLWSYEVKGQDDSRPLRWLRHLHRHCGVKVHLLTYKLYSNVEMLNSVCCYLFFWRQWLTDFACVLGSSIAAEGAASWRICLCSDRAKS